jgi:hypothetical protein
MGHDHRAIDYDTLTDRERRLIARALYDAAVSVARYPVGYFGSRYAVHWWLRRRAWSIRDGRPPAGSR